MRIGELAQASGVSPRSLRYYEAQGLLAATRAASGQRHYSVEAIARVRLVQQLFAAGLSSSNIVELLPCVYTGVATPEMIEKLLAERLRIERQIAELSEARDKLGSVLDTASSWTGHSVLRKARAARPVVKGTAAIRPMVAAMLRTISWAMNWSVTTPPRVSLLATMRISNGSDEPA